MKQQRLILLMTIFITVILVCFSQVAFGQRRKSNSKPKPRPVATPQPITQKVASQEIKLDQEAKEQIDSWMNDHFQEYQGKRYFQIKTVEKRQEGTFEEEANRKAALETIKGFGIGHKPLYYTELENMTWKINKEKIQVSALDRKNNEIIDEWRGTVFMVGDKSSFSRSFMGCGWTEFRGGFNDSSGNPLPSIKVYKRQGEWHFETGDKLYENVDSVDIIRTINYPTLKDDKEMAKRLTNFVWSGRCQ